MKALSALDGDTPQIRIISRWRWIILVIGIGIVFAAETIEHGKTGLVFHEQTSEALRAAVANLETTPFDRLALRARAEALRLEVFEQRVRAFVAEALAPGAPGC